MIRATIFFLLFYTSCINSFDPLQSELWALSSTYGYMTQMEQDASELPYAETVEFVSDGMFLKSRTIQNETEVLAGEWTTEERDGREGYRVVYPEDHPFIQNCTMAPEEFYFIREGLLIQSDFTPCDGPEYRYARVGE